MSESWKSQTKRTLVDSLVEGVVLVAVIETAVAVELRPIAVAVVSRWSLLMESKNAKRRRIC